MERPAQRHASLGRHGPVTIARGSEILDRGSLFTAQAAWPVQSAEAAAAAIAMMRQDPVCASADHNMTAYRVVTAKGKTAKEYDDDGEARGGQRLLGCLTQLKTTNVAVVVSRVYGGQNLGKARFDHICNAARVLLIACGHEPGVGIRHDWGSGHTLGGTQSPVAAAASASTAATAPAASSGSKKRKAGSTAAQTQAEEAAAKRVMLALAAERRLSAGGLPAHG